MNLFQQIKSWIHKRSRTPIDKLIDLLGPDTVQVWNGVNYNREFCFRPDNVSSITAIKPEDYPVIQIGIGRYVSGRGDWGFGMEYTSQHVVELYVNREGDIVHVTRHGAYYNGSRLHPRVENDVDWYVKRIFSKMKLNLIKYENLNNVLRTYFSAEVPVRYYKYSNTKNIYTPTGKYIFHPQYLLECLKENETEYKRELEFRELLKQRKG